MSNRPHEFVGILGWPLDHTLSPVLHAAAFRALKIPWVYLTWPVHPEDLGRAVEGIRVLGARGANVTMPHKETVIPFLDALSPDAEAIGAVNTIHEVAGNLIGHNTDVSGFGAALEEGTGLSLQGERCLVLGAGGSARAVVRSLASRGAASVSVAARDMDRGAEVASLARGDALPWDRAGDAVSQHRLIVNCTPLGMSGEDPLDGAPLGPDHVVFDLVYAPPQTPLVERARATGATATGGLGMLVHQAADALRIWTGSEAPLGMMSAAAVHAVGISHSLPGAGEV